MSRAVSMSALLAVVLMTSAFAEEPSKTEGAKAESKVDAAKGGAIAQAVCSACHGADGNATGPTFPKLAGQNATYLAKQLTNFKVAGDSKVPARNNAIMAPYAAALSDADIKNVSAYYASQAYKPATAKNKDSVALGEKIWRGGLAERAVPACAGCHSPNGAGIPVQYPRLAGQWGDYNEAQLIAFKTGTRKNNVPMAQIASRLSDAEIKAVADYAAGLR